MHYRSLDHFLTDGNDALAKGPIAMILVEDDVEIDTTLRHHHQLGFTKVIAFMPKEFDLPRDVDELLIRVDYNLFEPNAMETVINRVIEAAEGQWLYFCYNAEYLFYPFCETRNVVEMLAFHTEERQLDFFGGLRWRFEEHVPAARRKIDRISIFRAKPGLKIRDDHTFNDEEYNTYSCPWHHNITSAVCSFRTAKALKKNPGSKFEIKTFKWHNSAPFEWHSRQLLDLGLIEPGQWF